MRNQRLCAGPIVSLGARRLHLRSARCAHAPGRVGRRRRRTCSKLKLGFYTRAFDAHVQGKLVTHKCESEQTNKKKKQFFYHFFLCSFFFFLYFFHFTLRLNLNQSILALYACARRWQRSTSACTSVAFSWQKRSFSPLALV